MEKVKKLRQAKTAAPLDLGFLRLWNSYYMATAVVPVSRPRELRKVQTSLQAA